MAHPGRYGSFALLAVVLASGLPARADIVWYNSETSFLAAVGGVSKDTFEEFNLGFFTPVGQASAVIGGIEYISLDPSMNRLGVFEGFAGGTSNALGWAAIAPCVLRPGGPNPLGFGFSMSASLGPTSPPALYEIVAEASSGERLEFLAAFTGQLTSQYFGFHSTAGIEEVRITPIPTSTGVFNYDLDDVSRTLTTTATVPEPGGLALALIGATGVMLLQARNVGGRPGRARSPRRSRSAGRRLGLNVRRPTGCSTA